MSASSANNGSSLGSISKGPNEESKSDDKENSEKPIRSIGRWTIGSTLGKGGYSWVKKGYDKKTGKCVALKFMRKADKTWEKEQTKQVVTEIECLKQIRHVNVLKLYAYNLNAKYPTESKKINPETGVADFEKINTILLVLEYAPGGELFDILYYTHPLESVLARTYFRQALAGLEACHNHNIAHRDIKPQNLLLDSRFMLKICDFGLSKVFESDSDGLMKTSYVGTKGYQAPELVLEKTYDQSCDIFSLGVVLFILINGYPPFEAAASNDRWFNPLVNGDTKKFWKLHKQCKIIKDENCKDMLQKMLTFDPKERITINELKNHKWYNGKYLEGKNLIKVLRQRHREMEIKRKKDGRKDADLKHSLVNRAVNIKGVDTKIFDKTVNELFDKNNKIKEPIIYPSNFIEGCNDNEQYSTSNWQNIITAFKCVIESKYGKVNYDSNNHILHCSLKFATKKKDIEKKDDDKEYDKDVLKKDIKNNHLLSFNIKIFESKLYKSKNKDENIYVIQFDKTDGNTLQWTKLRNSLLLDCTSVITGLPDDDKVEMKEQKDVNDDNDDYDKVLNDQSDIWE